MWEVTENMIEILVFYITIGAIFGLLNWIVDMFMPTPNAPLTTGLLIAIILLWPCVIYKGAKLFLYFYRRNRHDRT